MKVVHLDHTRERGGAEYALSRMLRAPQREWEATLILPRSADEGLGVYEDLSNGDVRVVVSGPEQRPGVSSAGILGTFRFGVGLLRQAAAVRSTRGVSQSDVVHSNTSRSSAYGALALLFSRKPFVVHLRDIVDRRSLGAAGYALMAYVALRRADGVIANSDATLKSVQSIITPHTPTAVIPSAIGGIRPEPREDDGTFRIGMVARLDPWKGQKELIQSFAQAFPDGGAELVFAGAAAFGHDAYEHELDSIATALGVRDRVKFLGHVDDIGAVLRSLDVCAHASTRPEPLGQNMLQYLAAGRATVAVDAGGPAQWIQHDVNGRLFPINDRDALTRELELLRVDAAMRSRLAAAGPRTPGLPTDSNVTKMHQTFFEKVIESKSISRTG